MIIRATKKLLNSSKIEPIKYQDAVIAQFPGEWYAGFVYTGIQVKMIIHFLHNPSKLSILCPGKSLKNALELFPDRLEKLLERQDCSKLFFHYQADTVHEVYTTESRSMLAFMNHMRYIIENKIASAEKLKEINYSDIEDLLCNMVLSSPGPKKYEKPLQIIKNQMNVY